METNPYSRNLKGTDFIPQSLKLNFGMIESEFRNILGKIDDIFLVRKIGSTGPTWIAIGELFEHYTEDDITKKLKEFPISLKVNQTNGMVWLTVEEEKETIINIPPINLILFFATVFTTLLAGSLMEGGNLFRHPSDIFKGAPFSFTLLLILGTHEFGHYYFALKHRVNATLPYFIPVPPPFILGTLGAFIRIKSPIQNRRALLEIGAAGPIAGFIIAVLALIIGLLKSKVVILTDHIGIYLGDSLLMKFLTSMTFPGLAENQDILLHPIAFAGWIGLLVTMLNLLPLGQLDGGHIAYAILGEKQNKLAKWIFLGLIPLAFFSLNWLIWGALILILMRTVRHPPILDINTPLSSRDKAIGWISLIIFIICFIPAPFG